MPQGSYLQTGQNLVYGSQYATSGQQPGYGEAQNVGYSMGSGMSAGSYMQGDGKMGMSSTKEKGFIGAYSPEARRERIERFVEKRKKRVWTKKVKYDVRKNFADSRLRVKVNIGATHFFLIRMYFYNLICIVCTELDGV